MELKDILCTQTHHQAFKVTVAIMAHNVILQLYKNNNKNKKLSMMFDKKQIRFNEQRLCLKAR